MKKHVIGKGWLLPEHLHRGLTEVSLKWGLSSLPHSALINKKGEIIWRGDPESIDLQEYINDLLE